MAPLPTHEFGFPGGGSSTAVNTMQNCTIKGYDDAREPTTLERCRDMAMGNMHGINEIGSRITILLNKLGGPVPRSGGESDEGEAEQRGMLTVHLDQLEYEARRLGEIFADIERLEKLL